MKKLNTNSFITRAIIVHKNRYYYTNVRYQNTIKKVEIVCPIHGNFLQAPYSHLRGSGCPKCRYSKDGCGRIKSTSQFIEDATKMHGDLYDYSKSVYIGANKKLEIICSNHGPFFQTPTNHVKNKNGCPKCRRSRGELKIEGWLTENGVDYIHQKKFFNCKSNKNRILKFDFYIPPFNLIIEYDGEQHFRRVSFGSHRTNKEFEDTKERDRIKNRYCKHNGITLVRISYKDFGIISEILEKNICVPSIYKERK